MNWLTNVFRPKIKGFGTKRDTADTLWEKCPACGEMIFHRDLDANQRVCPSCNHHMRIGPAERFAALFDEGAFEEIDLPDVPADPLHFRDVKRYTDKLKEARAKTDQEDAIRAAYGTLEGRGAVILVQSFFFMGGSLGTAAGEAIVEAARVAVERHVPLIMVAASGGARMQEGILSLMQMPRTTIAVERLKEAGLAYIVLLTDPTSGGVTASYAMLGDVQIAEPGAMIAFSGPRVIEQTIRERLPDGFQRAEYLLDHGMIDMVVHRHELKATLARLISLMMEPVEPDTQAETPAAVPASEEPGMPAPDEAAAQAASEEPAPPPAATS